MTRALVGVLALIALLGQASSQLAAQAGPPLNFFKNYLITGDYAVQGIGLRGTGTGARRIQTGFVRAYAGVLTVGAILLVAVMIVRGVVL